MNAFISFLVSVTANIFTRFLSWIVRKWFDGSENGE